MALLFKVINFKLHLPFYTSQRAVLISEQLYSPYILAADATIASALLFILAA